MTSRDDYLRILEAERFNVDYLKHSPADPDATSWPGHPRSRKRIWWDAGRYAQGARDEVALRAYDKAMSELKKEDQ